MYTDVSVCLEILFGIEVITSISPRLKGTIITVLSFQPYSSGEKAGVTRWGLLTPFPVSVEGPLGQWVALSLPPQSTPHPHPGGPWKGHVDPASPRGAWGHGEGGRGEGEGSCP